MIRDRKERFGVRINCWLETEGGMYCMSTLNLSETGVAVSASDPLQEGMIVNLKFFTPFSAEPLAVRGEIIWSRSGPDGAMGIRFLDMDAEAKETLRYTSIMVKSRS